MSSGHRLGLVAWPTLGFQVVHWAMTHLCHGPGDVAGDDLVVDDEIALHICWLYRLWPAGHKLKLGARSFDVGGRRLARRGVLSRPKGRAKSEIAGVIVCAEACGPVRFSHWAREGEVSPWGYPYMRGEPVGRPVKHPLIRILATEEGQTGNTYDNVPVMMDHRPFVDRYGHLDFGRSKETSSRIYLPGGGEIRPCTASSASKDGGKESFAEFEEPHLYTSEELRRMHRTVSRNTAKRKDAEPWKHEVTTAFEIGERSIAETAHAKYGNLDPDYALRHYGVVYDHREAPHVAAGWYEDEKRDDEVIEALYDVYGPFAQNMDMRAVLTEMRDPEATEEEGYRYFFNVPSAASSKWCSEATFDGCPEPQRPLRPGELVALGFDGSENDDSTVLFASRLSDGALFPLGIWEKPPGEAGKEWQVPKLEVDAATRHAFRTYVVCWMEADRPYFEEYVDRWAAEFGRRREFTWDIVHNFPTKSDTRMAPALHRLLTAMAGRRIPIERKGPHGALEVPGIAGRTYGEALRAHFLNAHKRRTNINLEPGKKAVVVRKDRDVSPNKIDSVPAAALAEWARGRALEFGALKKQTQAWETTPICL